MLRLARTWSGASNAKCISSPATVMLQDTAISPGTSGSSYWSAKL